VYAVVQSGGQQHKVKVGQTLMVEKIAGAAEAGARVELDRVLAIGGDDGSTIGTPTIAGARVIAEVVDPDAKGKKLIVFKYKAKVRYRRKTGHRQHYTQLKVTEIVPGDGSASATTSASARGTTQRARSTAPGAAESARETVAQAAETARDTAAGATETVRDTAAQATETAGDAAEAVRGAATKAAEAATSATGTDKKPAEAGGEQSAEGPGITPGLVVEAVRDVAAVAAEAAVDLGGQAIEKAQEVGADAVETVVDKVKDVLPGGDDRSEDEKSEDGKKG
jgi:large subunit ribosomal protein L21